MRPTVVTTAHGKPEIQSISGVAGCVLREVQDKEEIPTEVCLSPLDADLHDSLTGKDVILPLPLFAWKNCNIEDPPTNSHCHAPRGMSVWL